MAYRHELTDWASTKKRRRKMIIKLSTYHELARIHLNINNPRIGFVERATNVLNIQVALLAFFPMLRSHSECLVNVAGKLD